MPFMMKNPYAKGEKRTSNSPDVVDTPVKKTKKVPTVKSLVMMEIAPNSKAQKRRPDVAPLNICIYKVTDNAGDVWSMFKNCASTKLWQIQFEHDAMPSISFQLGNALDEFLKEKSSTDEDYPKNRDELLKGGGVSLRFSNNNDPENVGTQA